MDYFLPSKEGQTTPLLNPVYDGNKTAIAAWTAPGANTAARTANYYPGSLFPLDTATIPGAAGLPTGWASGLGLDSPYVNGQAGSPLPFARGGTLSPRNFASIMLQKSASARSMKYALPGQGVGVDALGLVTGALAQTSLYGKIVNLASGKPAQILDGYYQTGTSPSAGYRLTRSDLEKVSLLVPSFDQIQVGDLVVHYGDKEGQSGDPTKVGIVVYVPTSGIPVPGADPMDFLKQVVIVGANEGEGQVSLSTWISNGTSRGFTSDGAGLCARRLVGAGAGQVVVERSLRARGSAAMARGATIPSTTTQVKLNGTTKYLAMVWDSSHECTQKGTQDDWRWIPNTGEYLVLGQAKLTMYNGVPTVDASGNVSTKGLQPVAFSLSTKDESYSLSFSVWDRGYKKGDTNGNIYTNQGSGFELVALLDSDDPCFNPYTLYTYKLENRNAETGEYAATPGTYTVKMELDGSGHLQVRIGVTGSISVGSPMTKFAIRPLLPSVRPGDDVIVGARVAHTYKLQQKKHEIGGADVQDLTRRYNAVYDKKLLWRANLYIQETSSDWNDVHPWNVPPTGETTVRSGAEIKPIEDVSPWWKPEWGYNDWNRRYAGTFTDGGALTGITRLDALPVGAGNQSNIVFPAVMPARGNIKLTGKVAYSYPKHDYEGYEGSDSKGDAGSQDSPFDYVKKMVISIAAMRDSFNGAGEKFKKDRSHWPEALRASVTIADFSLAAYKENCFDTTVASEEDWKTKREEASYKAKVSKYAGIMPPGNLWQNYGVIGAETGDALKSYLPGLGLVYWATTWGTTNLSSGVWTSFSASGSTYKSQSAVEAGTDCIGFAQRAASYSGNTYQWPELYPGFAEATKGNASTNVFSIIGLSSNAATFKASSDYSTNQRSYPRTSADKGYDGKEMVYSSYIAERNPSATGCDENKKDKNPYLGDLRFAVPGDMYYYRKGADEKSAYCAHIAILSLVPATINLATSDYDVMKSIMLIESEYSGSLNYVLRHENSIYKYHYINATDDLPKQTIRWWRIVRLN